MLLSSSLLFGQTTITFDTLWLHRVNPDDEDIESYFPVARSSDPSVAKNLNTALQMQALGYTLTETAKAKLLKESTADVRSRTNLSFSYKKLSDHLVSVDINDYHTNNGMSLNGWDNIRRFYFETATGLPVAFRDIFSASTLNAQSRVLGQGFRSSLIQVMQRYQNGFREADVDSLDAQCECPCSKSLQTSLCDGKVLLTADPKTHALSFSMPDCDWMNPRSHENYAVTVPLDKAAAWLTKYGQWLLGTGPKVSNDTPYQLWSGSINGTIPITFILKLSGCEVASGSGLEIYDKFGTVIPLKFSCDNLDQVKIEEWDGTKAVATITAQFTNGKLVGTWEKADKSKKYPFEAKARQ